MVPVWATTAPVLKASIIAITGMRMAIPREAVVSALVGDGHQPLGTRANPLLALASDDDVCKARRLGPSTAAAVSVN
jgi:hypothetical protein